MSGVAQEIEFNPVDPNIVFLIMQQGDSTEFHKSLDNGITFTQKTNGWPAPGPGDAQKRTEIATTPADPMKIYALATGSANGGSGLYGIYVSLDQGESWTVRCCGPQPAGVPSVTNPNLMAWSDDGTNNGGQYYYDLAMEVSETDTNKIFVAGVNHLTYIPGSHSY